MSIPAPVDPVEDRVLDAAAVAGERFRFTVLARVVALDPQECLAAVDRAMRAGTVVTALESGEGWFADEAARRAIVGRLSLADRADLHRRTAAELELERGTDPGEIVRHWSAAVAATLDPVERARLQIRLAAAALRDGDLAVARQAARDAVAAARRSGSSELLAEAAFTLPPVGDAAWDGDVQQWCAEALAAPEVARESRVRLLARQTQAAVYSGRWDDALATSAAALRRAEELGRLDLLVEALTARQLATSGPDDVDELIRLADRMVDLGTSAGRPEIEMWGRLWRIDARWYLGDLAAIAAETTPLASCTNRLGDPSVQWHLPGTRAVLALARAQFDAAERLQDEAIALLERLGHPAAHGASISFGLLLGHHCGHRGDLLEPEAWDFGTDARWAMFSHLARGFVLVDAGRTDEAAAAYQRCGAPNGWRAPRMGVLLMWGMAARVAAALGATDDVRYLRERLEPYRGRYVVGGAGGSNFLGPVELALGVCATSLGDWTSAREDFRRASSLCREIGAPGYRVEADCLHAESLARSGDHASARTLAREALPLARTLGMTPWTARLERLGATENPLSAREREIAVLVADGLSNRAIAKTLVISERTAQNHVQHILGKLGFVNRAQIAAWVARQDIHRSFVDQSSAE